MSKVKALGSRCNTTMHQHSEVLVSLLIFHRITFDISYHKRYTLIDRTKRPLDIVFFKEDLKSQKKEADMTKHDDIDIKKEHIGSSFDDFLRDEGMYEDVVIAATKKALSFKLQQLMQDKHISKSALAKQMQTSRSALNRLLDPTNTSVTLQSISKAASILGKKVVVDLI